MEAVTELVSTGCGFPAIHGDRTGYQMLSNLGYEPKDAKDWNNCGCVVSHSRKTFQWTSAASISFAAALEFALNEGKSRLSGQQVSVPEKDPKTFASIEEIIEAWKNQFRYLVKQGVISLVTAQEIHKESGHRPFMSACNEYCLKNGKDLVDGGAKYNIGPVFTGVGLSVTANSLAAIRKLVFEDKKYTHSEIIDAINANWEGYEQLQPFSVNDGDGIRTTVFLAGCPLRCKWCSNPEGYSRETLVGWYQRKCIGCGKCAAACPQKIGINMNEERDKCIACGRCAEICPTGARSVLVHEVDADEVLAAIQKHRLFYAMSGGGITFSGGEATGQPEFLNYLTEHIYDMGYSMTIETSGFFDFEDVRESLERMDLIFMDLKHIDGETHAKYTGVPNEKILENMKRLQQLPGEVVIRIPVIGGVNNDEDNTRRSAAFVRANIPEARMELLPYHSFGMIKYEAISRPYRKEAFYRPSVEEMDRLREIVTAEGVELADFR